MKGDPSNSVNVVNISEEEAAEWERDLEERFAVSEGDDRDWRKFCRRARLGREQLSYLRRYYAGSMVGRLEGLSGADRRARELAFRRWCLMVVQVKVELHPGGRAVLRSLQSWHTIEVRWAGGQGAEQVTEYRVRADEGLGRIETSVSPYLAALFLHLDREPPAPDPAAPSPAAGKPASIAYYRNLLEEYEQLKRDGSPAPAKELASRRNANVGTVKAQLHRGRRYLGRKGKR